jgi:hypothetical protein
MQSMPGEAEPDELSGPGDAARGVVLGVLMSSVLWVGWALTLWMLW